MSSYAPSKPWFLSVGCTSSGSLWAKTTSGDKRQSSPGSEPWVLDFTKIISWFYVWLFPNLKKKKVFWFFFFVFFPRWTMTGRLRSLSWGWGRETSLIHNMFIAFKQYFSHIFSQICRNHRSKIVLRGKMHFSEDHNEAQVFYSIYLGQQRE